MQLMQYVSDVLTQGKHPAGFPAYLDIPKTLVDFCYQLYCTGEKRGIELGVTLSVGQGNTLKISGDVIDGSHLGTGITFPLIDDNSYFGDLHCHPSDSIGHKDGFAAHSAEDVVSMQKNKGKPLFLRFVSSGTKIYLMAYRGGYSGIEEKTVFGIRQKGDDKGTEYFEKNCPYNGEERNNHLINFEGNAFNLQTKHFRRITPGLGKEMERLSIKTCKKIARLCDLGFYAGDQGYGVSVGIYGYLRIYLEA